MALDPLFQNIGADEGGGTTGLDPLFQNIGTERDKPPTTPKPSYLKAAWTGLKGGIGDMTGTMEKAGRMVGLPTLKDVGTSFSEEFGLTPSPEEEENIRQLGIPGEIARGAGELPGAALKYGPAIAALGPVGGMAAVGALEEADKGPLEMAKGAGKGALMGGVFRGIEPITRMLPGGEKVLSRGLPWYARAGVGAGAFGGEALLEDPQHPERAIPPAVIGAGLMGIGGERPLAARRGDIIRPRGAMDVGATGFGGEEYPEPYEGMGGFEKPVRSRFGIDPRRPYRDMPLPGVPTEPMARFGQDPRRPYREGPVPGVPTEPLDMTPESRIRKAEYPNAVQYEQTPEGRWIALPPYLAALRRRDFGTPRMRELPPEEEGPMFPGGPEQPPGSPPPGPEPGPKPGAPPTETPSPEQKPKTPPSRPPTDRQMERILAKVREDGSVRLKELRKTTSLSDRRINEILQYLKDKGDLEDLGSGKYRVKQRQKGLEALFEEQPPAPKPEEPPAPSEPGPPPPELPPGKRQEVITPKGIKADTQFRVLDADQLIASHDTSFGKNPNYNEQLQERQREKVASQNQIRKMIAGFDPEQLGESRGADTGAPIVGPDNMIESGNGRYLALKTMYEQNHANGEVYKKWLSDNADRFGISKEDLSKIKNPILVRQRLTEMNPARRIEFARDANRSVTLEKTAAERSRADAERLTPEALAVLRTDEEGTIDINNQEFIQKFLSKMSQNELGDFVTKDERGNLKLSLNGIMRVKNALFAKAYGESNASNLLNMLTEDPDNNVKQVTNALLSAAPRQAALKAMADSGERHPLAINDSLANAVKILSDNRRNNVSLDSYLRQGNFFGKDPMETEILKLLEDYKRAPKKILDILDGYAKIVDKFGDPRQAALFGDTKLPSKIDILTAARELVEEKEGEKEQPGLFAPPDKQKGRKPTKKPVPGGVPGRVSEETGKPEVPPEVIKEPPPKPSFPFETGEKVSAIDVDGNKVDGVLNETVPNEKGNVTIGKPDGTIVEVNPENVKKVGPKFDISPSALKKIKAEPEFKNLKGDDLRQAIGDLAQKAFTGEGLSAKEEKLLEKLEGKGVNFYDMGKALAGKSQKLEEPKASIVRASEEGPFEVDQLQGLIDKRIKEIPNHPRVRIMDAPTVDDIPARLRPPGGEGLQEGKDVVRSLYDDRTNTIWVNRPWIQDEAMLKEAMEHELAHHYVDADTGFLNQVFWKYGMAGMRGIAKDYGFDLSTPEGRFDAAREKLSQIAQTNSDPGLLNRFFAYARDLLRKMGIVRKFSDDDLKAFLWKSRESMIQGDIKARQEKVEGLRRQVSRIQTTYNERPRYMISPVDVGHEFYKQDIFPDAVEAGKGFKSTLDWLKDLWVPAAKVPKEALESVHHYLGQLMKTREILDLKEVVGDLTGRKIGDTFSSMSPDDITKFIDRAKLGYDQETPQLDQIRDFMGRMDQKLWEDLKYWKPDLGWVENHLRLFLKPGTSEAQAKSFAQLIRRRFQGTMGWSERMFFDTLTEARQGGFELAVDNPWEMWKANFLDGTQFIQFKEMQRDLQEKGFLKKFEPEGPGKAFKDLEGYAKTTENMNNIWFNGKGEGWYIEENLGRILNNYLSPDRIRANALGKTMMSIKNHTTVAELALNAFHATATTLNSVFSGLGEAGRKIYNVGIVDGNREAINQGLADLPKSALAPYDMTKLGSGLKKFYKNKEEFLKSVEGNDFLKRIPNPEQWADLLWDVGGRFGIAEDYKLNSLRTFKENIASKNYIGAALRSIPALNNVLMKPLFEHYIPNLKVGTWLKETMDEVGARSEDILAGKTSKWEIGYEKWKSVENRFGEMSFDNLFWNRTFKTAMQMMVRSMTWQIGNIKAFGKGIAGQSAELISAMREGRMPKLTPEGAWMMATFAGTAALGSITQYAFTGKNPESWKDYFYPQIDKDGNRVSIPGYARVGFSMVHDPQKYAKGALAGYLGRFQEVINNKDFYGTQIHDPESNAIEQRVDDLIHLVPLPFSISSMRAMREAGEPVEKQLTGFLGATKAPYWITKSDAEQKAMELKAEHYAGMPPRSKEDTDRYNQVRKYAQDYLKAQHEGQDTSSIMNSLHEDILSGKLHGTDMLRFRQKVTREPLVQTVSGLPFKEALKVYAVADSDEKKQLRPILMRQFAHLKSPEDKRLYLPRIQEIRQEF